MARLVWLKERCGRARRRRRAVARVSLLAAASLTGASACSDDVAVTARTAAESASVRAEAQGKLDDARHAAKDRLERAQDKLKGAKRDIRDRYDRSRGTLEDARASIDSAQRSIVERAAAARAWAADLPSTGELSSTARSWLDAGADEHAIERWVARGRQVAPVAVAIGSKIAEAVDTDTVLEPVYQSTAEVTSDGKTGNTAVDEAIADMGRVEVIDGLSVGFKQLTTTSTKERASESGYLVLWRRGDHLIGFVYRSRKAVDIEALVAAAPQLVKLATAGADAAA